MSAAAAASASVQRIIPGFAALSEQGHWDACAVVAELDAVHACAWATVDAWDNPSALSGLVKAWRNDYIAANRWTVGHGTTLGSIYWHLATHKGWGARIAGYIPCVNSPNLTALHTFVKQHTYAGNPVIVFISRAYKLTANEQGVYGHFVTLGGIDSERGYLTANGDTLDGLKSAAGAIIPCQWNTWAQLTAAGINGAIALDASSPAPVVTTPPPAPPAGDSSSDALTLLDSALSALQSLRGKLS